MLIECSNIKKSFQGIDLLKDPVKLFQKVEAVPSAQGEPDCAAPGALRNGVCGRSAGQRGDQ